MGAQHVPRVLHISELARVTFYQWLALEQCNSKGILRSVKFDSALPVPSPTRAVLVGRFHHQVMEWAASATDVADLDTRIEDEIARLQVSVDQCPQLRKAGSVSGWDEINKSASLGARIIAARAISVEGKKPRIEKELHSTDGRLVGRPDFFVVDGRRALLREYKSTAIRKAEGNIEPTYLDQLQFYAALLFANYEIDEVVARLESLNGDSWESVITKHEAQKFEGHVKDAIDRVNANIRLGRGFTELAQPSKEACSFCDAKLVCGAFKREQDQLNLEGEQFIVEGSVIRRVPHGVSASDADVMFADEYRKTEISLTVPHAIAVEMAPQDRWVLCNLRRHGGTLQWGHASSALICK